MSTRIKSRPGQSPAHIRLIRQLPCACCLNGSGSDPHHLLQITAERGVGMKATDRWSVPLCRLHHNELHKHGARREAEFFAYFGVEARSLAEALWSAGGNVQRMRRIVLLQHVPGARA